MEQLNRTKRKYHEQQRDWAEIPVDVLSIIFEKLGAVDLLVSAQGVCRSWRMLAFDPTIQVWRCIDMRSDPQKSLPHCMSAVERSKNRLEKLYAVNVHGDILNYIAERIPNLKCLGIIGTLFYKKEVFNLLAQCPLLEELHICSPAFDEQFVVDIVRTRPELKRLRVEERYSLDTNIDFSSDSTEEDSISKEKDSSKEDTREETSSSNEESSNEEDSSSSEEDWNSSEEDWSSTELKIPTQIGPNPTMSSEEDWSSSGDSSEEETSSGGDSSEEETSSGDSMIQLRKLRFDKLWINNKSLHAILDKCIHLEYLDLRSCHYLVIDAVLQAKLDKIETVRLSQRCVVLQGNN